MIDKTATTGSVATKRLRNGTLVPVAAPAVARRADERGMVSAEWAVGIILAISLVGVVLTIVTKGPVREALAHFFLTLIGMFVKVGQGG